MAVNKLVDTRFAEGLVRLGQILAASMSAAAVSRGLSQLQLEILSCMSTRELGEPVGFLAKRFMISPATISDSLRALETKGLITRKRHPDDARSVLVMITVAGREAAAEAVTVIERVSRIVADWDERRRAEMHPAICELINRLQKDSASVDRMCLTCLHFAINCDLEGNSAPYFCRVFNIALREIDLRIECGEFESQK